jgi:zinc protease
MKYLRYLLYFLLFSFSAVAEIDLTKKLPMDPKITYGRLDNGVTYYIKNNQLPKNKAILTLGSD